MPPAPAEIEKALRYHAAKMLKADDCGCDTCTRERFATRLTVGILAWVAGQRATTEVPTSFAGHLAELYQREDIARLTHDPRMREVLPDYTFPEVSER